MGNRSKAIWAVAIGFIILGSLQSQLSMVDLFFVFLVAIMLENRFGDKKTKPTAALPPEVEQPKQVFVPPAGKHLITTDGVKQLRNLLLRHHNMKQTDEDYTRSAMSKETVMLVATMNVFLKGK